jgi:hypothetical protein
MAVRRCAARAFKLQTGRGRAVACTTLFMERFHVPFIPATIASASSSETAKNLSVLDFSQPSSVQFGDLAVEIVTRISKAVHSTS